VFDVSLLLGANPPLSGIRESFVACVNHENKLQEKAITARQVLADTLSFCNSVVSVAQPPEAGDGMQPVLAENVKGLPDFAGHLFEKGYSWTHLRRDMARVALCIAAVCNPTVSHEEFANALSEGGDDPNRMWNTVTVWSEAG
jgi:hypothetical protein